MQDSLFHLRRHPQSSPFLGPGFSLVVDFRILLIANTLRVAAFFEACGFVDLTSDLSSQALKGSPFFPSVFFEACGSVDLTSDLSSLVLEGGISGEAIFAGSSSPLLRFRLFLPLFRMWGSSRTSDSSC